MALVLRSLDRFLSRLRRAQRIKQICRKLPKAAPDPPPRSGTVTIAGILRSPTGIGEGARLQAQALSRLGYAVGLCDFSRQRRAAESLPLPQGPRMTADDAGGPIIIHLNPPSMLYTLEDMLGALAGRRIIANWVWEAPVMPPVWHRALEFLHEVWVPSRFVGAAVATGGAGLPIRLVPYAVRPTETVTPLAIAPGKLMYLTMFSYDSGFKRKNPIGTIRAFRCAFGDRADVILLVKAQGSSVKHEAASRELEMAIGDAKNVSIFNRDLSTPERDALIARADVVVSLHRSEGFGLTLAEAMLLGKAVVATNWSGNIDFMPADACSLIDFSLVSLSDAHDAYAGLRTHWAEPDLDHAASEMLRLADPAVRSTLGVAAQRAAKQYFGLDAFAAAVEAGIGPPPPTMRA